MRPLFYCSKTVHYWSNFDENAFESFDFSKFQIYQKAKGLPKSYLFIFSLSKGGKLLKKLNYNHDILSYDKSGNINVLCCIIPITDCIIQEVN